MLIASSSGHGQRRWEAHLKRVQSMQAYETGVALQLCDVTGQRGARRPCERFKGKVVPPYSTRTREQPVSSDYSSVTRQKGLRLSSDKSCTRCGCKRRPASPPHCVAFPAQTRVRESQNHEIKPAHARGDVAPKYHTDIGRLVRHFGQVGSGSLMAMGRRKDGGRRASDDQRIRAGLATCLRVPLAAASAPRSTHRILTPTPIFCHPNHSSLHLSRLLPGSRRSLISIPEQQRYPEHGHIENRPIITL
ncbi:hypothetical protein BC629DRAFT_1436893 [Irpex lacteus]|nr:hypothetical protein BC629DRAFT_1436893 [Irpex lacteus]